MKKTILFALIMIMLMAPVAMADTVIAGNTQIPLPAGAEVIQDQRTTLIPVIPVLQAMNYEVEYHEDCGYVTANKPGISVAYAVGSKGYLFNGQVWRAFSPLEIRQGVLYTDRLDLQWMLSDGRKYVPVWIVVD